MVPLARTRQPLRPGLCGQRHIKTPEKHLPDSTDSGDVDTDVAQQRSRRAQAAERYRPDRIRLLLIAEAPPADPDRYFYFHEVNAHDSLFRHVIRSLLGVEPTRENKAELLAQLQQQGTFLIDLKPDPVDSTPLNSYVPELVHRVHRLSPERIVLIKATVYDAAYAALAAAGLPVSSVRVPFPGSGQQTNFLQAFANAVLESEADTVAAPEPALSPQRRFAFDLAEWFEANAKQIGEDYDRYFTSFTGRWFEHFGAVGDPNRFDASDLVAVEALSVQVPPRQQPNCLSANLIGSTRCFGGYRAQSTSGTLPGRHCRTVRRQNFTHCCAPCRASTGSSPASCSPPNDHA